MGRDYPTGYNFFKFRLKGAFLKKASLTSDVDIENAVKQGRYVLKELEALWYVT